MWNESKLQWYWPLNCTFSWDQVHFIKYISFLATCGFKQIPRTKSKMIVEILGKIKSMKDELKHQSEWKVFHSVWTFIYQRILLLYSDFLFFFANGLKCNHLVATKTRSFWSLCWMLVFQHTLCPPYCPFHLFEIVELSNALNYTKKIRHLIPSGTNTNRIHCLHLKR